MPGKKYFLITDLEGVAGVTTFDDVTLTGRYYERSKYLLTSEVNAVVEGLLEESEAEIYVLDGHGCGGINYEEIHPDVKLLTGRGFFLPLEMDRGYDALLFVGQHARNGAPNAHLNHTMDHHTIFEAKVNGIPIGEFGIWAAFAGELNIPTIFLSGDSAACREAGELVLDIITVEVKEGVDRELAIHLSHQKAIELLKAGSKQAVKAITKIKPLKFAPPYIFELSFIDSLQAKRTAVTKKGKLKNPNTVVFEYSNYWDVANIWF
ncbi:M55 family metallopeptidase [candidate division KSB1 bacterium]|nr:M55 family metallopeptidase [candidate division KSB1 bacterium]